MCQLNSFGSVSDWSCLFLLDWSCFSLSAKRVIQGTSMLFGGDSPIKNNCKPLDSHIWPFKQWFFNRQKLQSLSLLFVWELWLPCIADILMIATIGFHKIAPKCFQLVFRPRTFLDVKQRGLLEWTGQVDMWTCRCWHEDFRHPAPSFSEASVASPSESTLRWKSENAWYAAGSSLPRMPRILR